MSIQNYSIEELQQEIERKKKEAEKESIPNLRSIEDMKSDLVDFAMDFHKWFTMHVAKHKRNPKDNHYYAFESLIDFLYGREYWKWYNGICK